MPPSGGMAPVSEWEITLMMRSAASWPCCTLTRELANDYGCLLQRWDSLRIILSPLACKSATVCERAPQECCLLAMVYIDRVLVEHPDVDVTALSVHRRRHIRVCVCVYMYVYVCVYMYVCICVYIYIYVCMCVYIYIYICMYTYVYIHMTHMIAKTPKSGDTASGRPERRRARLILASVMNVNIMQCNVM